MDNFEAFIIGALVAGLLIGIPLILISSDAVLIDGSGVASDLSKPQMQDIANYIEEKYPSNFNYDTKYGECICRGRCCGDP